MDVTATTVEEAKENILAVLKKTAPGKLKHSGQYSNTEERTAENEGGQEV